jgi:hypothetical protein
MAILANGSLISKHVSLKIAALCVCHGSCCRRRCLEQFLLLLLLSLQLPAYLTMRYINGSDKCIFVNELVLTTILKSLI